MKGALPKNGCKPQFLTRMPTEGAPNASKKARLAKAGTEPRAAWWVLTNVLTSDSTSHGVALGMDRQSSV